MSAKPHHMNVRIYLGVFAVLAFLTVVTVAVSYLHLPMAGAVLIALTIATFKALLVATFFMHLKGERVLIYGLLGLTLVFMALLVILPVSDTAAIDTRIHHEATSEAEPAH